MIDTDCGDGKLYDETLPDSLNRKVTLRKATLKTLRTDFDVAISAEVPFEIGYYSEKNGKTNCSTSRCTFMARSLKSTAAASTGLLPSEIRQNSFHDKPGLMVTYRDLGIERFVAAELDVSNDTYCFQISGAVG